MMKPGYTYSGNELELFSKATNWKRYVSLLIKEYISGDVAEVGAGTGNFTVFLQSARVNNWTYIEPDESFRECLRAKTDRHLLPSGTIYETWTTIPESNRFNTILYLDVLEHIEDDETEVQTMIQHLKPGGHIVLLAPAYPFLYSSFDKEIGHFRRYTRKHLMGLFSIKQGIVCCKYLDSAGFFTSLANRCLLKQTYPTQQQVNIWDSLLIPVSKILDKLFLHAFGRSVILVWKKKE